MVPGDTLAAAVTLNLQRVMYMNIYLSRLAVGLIGLGLGYGVVRLAGWTDLDWLSIGVPIMTSGMAMGMFNVWKARHDKKRSPTSENT